MNPIAFQQKWTGVELKERSAAQEHFLDLCAMLGHQTPAQMDRDGTTFTFERGAAKSTGGQGWADVWYRGHFAWEYKGPHKDLVKAYDQLLRYKDDLENPPLLIVSDLDRIEIHTNFTGTVKHVHVITLETITDPASLAVLRAAFEAPATLKPNQTVAAVTEEASRQFGKLALGLRDRGADPNEAAHFLMQLLFCLFAEDIGILPNRVFSRLLDFSAKFPARFEDNTATLLTAMATGGEFNLEIIPHVNGGLFSRVKVFPLTADEIDTLAASARLDWSSIEPAIFGTLFERSLDPARRAQLGAHYTGRPDIERVVDPVVMTPLRREWDEVRAKMDRERDIARDTGTTVQRRRNAIERMSAIQGQFLDRLAAVRVLDPACGSGNFLYVALERLLALEKEVIMHGAEAGAMIRLPQVGPRQLLGMEIDPLARELAQVAIWIGYLQWMVRNGFGWNEPVLEPLETIRLQDALLTTLPPDTTDTTRSGDPSWSPSDASPEPHATAPSRRGDPPWSPALATDQSRVVETEWPAAEFIIGNPPFLGGKRLRDDLGDEYVNQIFDVYRGRVARESDLVCYFFEKARAQIEGHQTQRAGLLATQAIRFGANRGVLEAIKSTGDIYVAWSDEPWILNGAAVRISIVGFDKGLEEDRVLNGQPVAAINADLSGGTDISSAARLSENLRLCFQGPVKVGAFELDSASGLRMLEAVGNPNGRPNRDVVKPWANATDIVRRSRAMFIIDFGKRDEASAAQYELPFEHVYEHVRPTRLENRDMQRRTNWWRLGRTITSLECYIHVPTRYGQFD